MGAGWYITEERSKEGQRNRWNQEWDRLTWIRDVIVCPPSQVLVVVVLLFCAGVGVVVGRVAEHTFLGTRSFPLLWSTLTLALFPVQV